MYIVFGNSVKDSEEVKKQIQDNTEFVVLKDMSKGSKREDIIAFNISIKTKILDEIMSDDFNIQELSEDEFFDEYLTLSEEIATEIEEFIPEESIMDIRAYKWDKSDEDIKLVIVVAHEELGKNKLKDVMLRLLKQTE